MRRYLAVLALFFAAPAFAQVQQSGNITAGHVPVWVYNGTIGDAGAATSGNVTEFGITKNGGLPFCINSQPTTQAYSELCMSTSDSQAAISLQGHGEATPPFVITLNGVNYPFPYQTGVAPVSISQFGAKSDGLTTVADGSLTIGSAHFCSSVVTFNPADVGKIFEANPAANAPPWRTTIASVDGGTGPCIELAYNSPITFPGTLVASGVTIVLPLAGSGSPVDAPGSGWTPGDHATAVGGTGTAAQITVKATGMVAYTQTSGGTGYNVGDIIYGNENGGDGGVTQKAPIQIQVLTVSSGVIQTSALLSNGIFQGADPTTAGITWTTSGSGTGFAASVLASAGSWGIVQVAFFGANKGAYSTAPTNPTAVTANSGTGTGATVNFAFSGPDWTYCTDDTVAVRATEAYLEAIPDTRGLSRAASLPNGTETCTNNFTITKPVMWFGNGPWASRLLQILGDPGVSVSGNPGSFIVPAVSYPNNDDYQNSLKGQPVVSFVALSIDSMSNSTTGYINNGSIQSFASNGLFQAAPVSNEGRVTPIYLNNVNFNGFPGDNWGGQTVDGAIEAFRVVTENASGSCLNMNGISQPSKIYGLIADGCLTGINIAKPASNEYFAGVELFNNGIGINVSGAYATGRTFTFDGLDCTSSLNECIYDNATKLTVKIMSAVFTNNNKNGNGAGTDGDSDIVLGSSAGGKGNQAVAAAVQVTSGNFDNVSTDYTVLFEPDANSNYCVPGCFVDINGYYLGNKGKTIQPISVYPTADQQYAHSIDLVGPLVSNGQGISFGDDASSASPCLLPTTGALDTISAIECDNNSDWIQMHASNFIVHTATNKVTISPPAGLAGNYSFTLPATGGVTGQPLVSGGSGTNPTTYGYPVATVTTLPTCNSGEDGAWYEVTDAAAAPVYNATATGGGSIHLPVFCNGSNWTNH